MPTAHPLRATIDRCMSSPAPNRRTLGRAFLLAVAGLLPGVPSPRTAAAELTDATCDAPLSGFSIYSSHRFAQTFTAKHSGRLTRVTVEATAAEASQDDYVFQIRTTNRKGKPTKTILAEAQVSDVVAPPAGETTTVTAIFAPGAKVTKGTRYALVVAGADGDLPNVRKRVDGCRGTLYDDDDLDGKFVKEFGADIVFTAYVTVA